MVCARLNFFKNFIFIFSPRRSRRGTLGISSPGGPVEEPLKPFCSFFSLCRLSSSVVFQWGSLRQTLDLSKTTNEKVPWRRPSIYRKHPLQELSFTVTFFYRKHPLQELSFFYRKHPLQKPSFTGTFSFRTSPLLAVSFYRNHIFEVSIFPTIPGQQSFSP